MDAEHGSPAALWPELTPEEAATLDAETLTIAERRVRVMKHYRAGRTMRQIVEVEGCSLGTVHADLKAVMDGWKRIAAQDFAWHLADCLSRLAYREADIEEQWERSKGDAVEVNKGRRRKGRKPADAGDGDPAADEVADDRVKQKGRYGDPRLAALLVQCWQHRCRLVGLLKAEDFRKAEALPPVKYVAGLDPAEVV